MNGWEEIARWSPWVSFVDAVAHAPLSPDVYVARVDATGPVLYVGMAGARHGRGLRGRLRVYASGKAAVSGLGEAALNRALADPAWLQDRLAELEAGQPRTASSGLARQLITGICTSAGPRLRIDPQRSPWSGARSSR